MKKLIVVAVLVCSLATAFALPAPGETDWHLAVEPVFGATLGHLGEYVFQKKSDGSYKKLSYLEWDEKPIWNYGARVDGGYKGLRLNLSFMGGILRRCGETEDSDWMNDNDDSMKTTFSVSENSVTSYFDFAVALRYEFAVRSWLTLAPTAEFMYKHREFSAENGYGWYGQGENPPVSWNDPAAKYYEAGELYGIDYERQMTYLFIGASVQCKLPKGFSLALSAAIAPYAYEESLDTHYKTLVKNSSNQYLDIVESYFSRVKGSVALNFSANKYIDVAFTVSGFTGWLKKGLTANKNAAGKFIEATDVKSGADISEANFQISCRVHIL